MTEPAKKSDATTTTASDVATATNASAPTQPSATGETVDSSDSFYAWSNFETGGADGPQSIVRIKTGDPISQADLDVNDEEWQSLIDGGAVRPYPLPDGMENFPGSPVEFAKAQMAAAAEGNFFDTQYGRVGVDTPPAVDPETGKAIPPGTNA